jgi:hypothetical protein
MSICIYCAEGLDTLGLDGGGGCGGGRDGGGDVVYRTEGDGGT